jgi:phosphodiesterase/alkaline phosphatase D-like protein
MLSLDITTDPQFISGIVHRPNACTTDPAKDYTCKVTLAGLTPNTVYFYRFSASASEMSNVGRFKTAPLATASAPLHFGFSGDYDGLIRPYALASQLPSQNLDFYMSLGDTIYETASNLTGGTHSGPALNSAATTLTGSSATLNGPPTSTGFATAAQLKADYERKYREQFFPVNTNGQNGLQPMFAGQGNYTTYDNHELGNRQYINGGAPAGGSVGGADGLDMPTGRGVDARKNGSGNPGNVNDANNSPSDYMNRSMGFQTLQNVFLEYQPIADHGTVSNPADPRTNGTKQLYFAQQWGKNAIFINTDARSYRDIRMKSADGSLDDTSAPRANNKDRTYLGATQFAWLKQTLLTAENAGTTWKFVQLSDPIDQIGPIGGSLGLSNLPDFGLPGSPSSYAPVNSDGGKSYIGGYRAERNALLKFIADNHITNVVFIATDDHQNRVNELAYSPSDTENQATYIKVPSVISIVAGPLGATGPDLILNHSFTMAQQYANSLVAAQQAGGIEPFGLMGYPGLHDVFRNGDPTAGTSPQAVDFYSPDTFNFNTLDVTADGKTLTVTSIGMSATAQNAGIEYANGPQAGTIFSFKIDAVAPVVSLVNGFAQTSPTLRNNYDGFAGMQLTVGENPLSVYALGRACLPGNSQTHPVKLVNASTKADVAGATAQVIMLNCTPGQTVYANLANPVTLVPGTTYYLVSQEFKNGDMFYEHAPISVKSDVSVISSVYFNGVQWIAPDSANTSYVPPDMRYTVLSAPSSLAFVLDYNKDYQALRKNFTGFVGAAVSVSRAPLKVTSLGRACAAGDSQTHTVKLVSGATGLDIPGASASVNMAGCIQGQFVYTDLPAVVTLLANTTYYLLSQETTGGDQWYDQGTVRTRPDAVVTDAIFSNGTGWVKQHGLNNSYGPSNFKYSVTNCAVELGCAISTPVVINEVESSGGVPGDWAELYNPGPGPANISGYIFRDNDDTHTYVIPAGTIIPAKGYFVLEEAAFGFGLGAPDATRLFDPTGALADAYSWTVHAATTYGRCPTPAGGFATTGASTKGAANICAAPAGAIVINEVESNGGVPGDWFEIYNTTASAIDLTGWKMLDNDDTHTPFAFPQGTTIAAGGYFVGEEAQFVFGLGAPDSVRIYDPSGALYASYSWTTHATTTYGRCPNGVGDLTTTNSSTKGAANDCGSTGSSTSVKINEVESDQGVPGDWVELYNTGTSSVSLAGFVFKDNDDGHSYIIPSGTSIPAGGYLVLDEAQFVFGLGSADSARLFDPNGVLLDSYSWTAHATTTYGRCPNGTGAFTTTTASTKGTVNACPGDVTYAVWPGGATIQDAGPNNSFFGGNLSGLVYEASGSTAPGVLWGVRNGPSAIFRLIFNGSIWVADTTNNWSLGKQLRYPDGTGDPDSEGITFAGSGSSLGLYVSTERNNSNNGVSRLSVLRYDPLAAGSTLTATQEWNLTADLPVSGPNLGLEAITWVPDTFLTSKSFFDEAKGHTYNPSEYPNHGTGIFFVGLESNGMVYAYALDQGGTTYTKLATISTGFPAVMDLSFDRDSTELWAVCDDTCQGRTVVLRIDATGRFTVARRYERPAGMPNYNNEGFGIAPAALCSGGTKPVFWADDTEDNGQSLRSGTLTCSPL